MRIALLLLALSAPAAAQRADVVELPPATLGELARVAVTPPAGEHAERPRPALAGMREAAGAVVAAELVRAPAAAAAPPPVLVGFSTLSGSIYPSAAYLMIDPAGNVSAAATVKDGEHSYGYFPWGDYSTTLVDPVHDLSFWTLQSYATPAPAAPFISWGTWWSFIEIKPPPRTRAVRH